jgi:protein translocase SecG subunit
MGENTLNALMITQIVASLLLVILVLLQNRSDGLGSMFGGGGGEVFRTKRGMEKVLHRITILLSVTVCVISLILVKYGS